MFKQDERKRLRRKQVALVYMVLPFAGWEGTFGQKHNLWLAAARNQQPIREHGATRGFARGLSLPNRRGIIGSEALLY